MTRRWRGRPRSSTKANGWWARRSEEHTSELQSLAYLVCRLLLEKKNNDELELVLDLLPLSRRWLAPPLAHPFLGPSSQSVIVVDFATPRDYLTFLNIGEPHTHPI